MLKEMGYSSYAEYLRSPKWQKIRARVWKRKGRDCWLCGDPATELHHASYERSALRGEHIDRIYPLCRACHVGIEFDSGGRKRTVRQAIFNFETALSVKREREKMIAVS